MKDYRPKTIKFQKYHFQIPIPIPLENNQKKLKYRYGTGKCRTLLTSHSLYISISESIYNISHTPTEEMATAYAPLRSPSCTSHGFFASASANSCRLTCAEARERATPRERKPPH